MPLFQESIVKKHLSKIDESVIESAYLEYKRVYSPEKIKNIKVAKEEQYQEGFIKDVFGSVLGYSVYPEHPYNIETEKKNETNSKKADGAILKDEKVVGVIELKDNKTKNLEAVKDQAFGYKHNHKECSYVISSNFHKLRFYIDDATDYEEFDLYNLDKETFKRFYLYLRKEGLLDKNLPKLLREETKFHEEEISKKLYKDYSNFKRNFYENAVKNNPHQDKLILFKKSQKFFDRILFLLFAEDKGLVGTNSIVNIVEKWSGADDDYYRPLYEMVNTYFGHLYRGYTYQKTGEVIPQFGGELFATDDVLELLKIDDDVLKNDLLVLAKYDFNTDVDVNILGHIFEHSLNEVDDVEAELRGEQLDKSKRKKDGVFYTPKYITKYIVDNTLGKLCIEKKAELKLDQDIAIFEYQKADGKLNEKGKDLYERLSTYKSWLLTLKVCDPACGSGAFLNQALSFFIEEHKFVDDIIAELTNTPLRLFDTDLQILENNIFGVDINEESIEIAKLSLWLRTAKPGRKLSDLSNNIKCGNSLIDDSEVAGDKAFNWQSEFPEVFNMGGFDIIIGNPPYGAELNENEKKYVQTYYPHSTIGKIDSYRIFIEHSTKICKNHGLISYIIPNTFMYNVQSYKLRKFLIDGCTITDAVELRKNIFEDAPDVVTVIFTFGNYSSSHYDFRGRVAFHDKKYSDVNTSSWAIDQILNSENLKSDKDLKINLRSNVNFESINEKLSKLEILDNHFNLRQGTKPYGSKSNKDVELISKTKYDNSWEEAINGRNIARYHLNFEDDYVKRSNDLHSVIDKEIVLGPKIYFQRMRKISLFPRIVSSFDDSGIHGLYTCSVIWVKQNGNYDLKFLLGLLNSLLINVWYKFYDTDIEIKLASVKQIPLPKVNKEDQIPLTMKVNQIMDYKIEFEVFINKFSKYFASHFQVESLPGKLSAWHELKFNDFIKELNKLIKGIHLTKKDEYEWMELFEENKKKVLDLKSQIDQTDKEIDLMVYELYALTEEEIQIVENN